MKSTVATLLTALALGLLAAPPIVDAEQASSVRRVGLLLPWQEIAPVDWTDPRPNAFRQRMRDLGYVEGQNVVFEGRRGPKERLPDLAAALVNLNVDVIVAWSTPAVAAAKQQTTSIPIVIASAGDAVRTGLVASLARPGGNVTGVSFQAGDLVAKRVQLILDMVPGASRIGVLLDSADPAAANARAGVEEVMRVTNLHFEMVEAATLADLEETFKALQRMRVDGVVVMPSSRYFNIPREIATAALNHRLVTVFGEHESVKAGGLIAYRVDWPEMARMAADYVDRIFQGAKPASLPVEQPTKFELVINMKTAKALGLTIPLSLLLQAHQVIE